MIDLPGWVHAEAGRRGLRAHMGSSLAGAVAIAGQPVRAACRSIYDLSIHLPCLLAVRMCGGDKLIARAPILVNVPVNCDTVTIGAAAPVHPKSASHFSS